MAGSGRGKSIPPPKFFRPLHGYWDSPGITPAFPWRSPHTKGRASRVSTQIHRLFICRAYYSRFSLSRQSAASVAAFPPRAPGMGGKAPSYAEGKRRGNWMKRQSLRRQTLVTTGCNVAVRGLGFLMRLGFSRLLGPEAMGIMELASGAHMLFISEERR